MLLASEEIQTGDELKTHREVTIGMPFSVTTDDESSRHEQGKESGGFYFLANWRQFVGARSA